MTVEDILDRLRSQSNPDNVAGMSRYGINPDGALGIPIPVLRRLAREIGVDHSLALALYDTGVHEATILAAMIDDPLQVTERQMEKWARAFDSWDVCDQVCNNLFCRTPLALRKVYEWTQRNEIFVKRAGFVLIAQLAVHDKRLDNRTFRGYLAIIERESSDARNFVTKAVNWALRQVGKRNPALNKAAVKTAKRIKASDARCARWIASVALRELRSDKVLERLKK